MWNKQSDRGEAALLAAGAKAFATLRGNAEARNFWWPHFLRVVPWLAERETEFADGLVSIRAESSARYAFQIEGDDYILTARADRIDILANGAVRLIDYKTGGLPGPDEVKSGKSPQMTLESALLLEGAFAPLSPQTISEALYIQIGRNRSSMNVKPAGGTKIVDFNALAREHLTNFKALLQIYRAKEISYLPRLMPKMEDEEMDYDHLSRFLEWQLSSPNPRERA